MIKVKVKDELKLLLLLLLSIPAIDIFLFQATIPLTSAVIIMVSLIVFFILVFFCIDIIIENLKKVQSDTVKTEKTYFSFMGPASLDLSEEIKQITNIALKGIKELEWGNSQEQRGLREYQTK